MSAMPSKSRTVAARPLPPGAFAKRRSGVTNGARLYVEGGDEGSPWTRRFSDLMALRIGDMGGADLLSEGQLSLCRRASALECELERMEASMSAGEEVDLKTFATAVGTLSRVLDKIGLKRVARDTAPTIDAILARHAS